MRDLTNRRLMLAVCATIAACATTLVCLVAATEAEASSTHPRKHHHHRQVRGFNEPWSTGGIRVVAPPAPVEDVCPGNRRSFDCKVWPPPFDQDPDRRPSGADAGG